jgi:hypothetical protein
VPFDALRELFARMAPFVESRGEVPTDAEAYIAQLQSSNDPRVASWYMRLAEGMLYETDKQLGPTNSAAKPLPKQ